MEDNAEVHTDEMSSPARGYISSPTSPRSSTPCKEVQNLAVRSLTTQRKLTPITHKKSRSELVGVELYEPEHFETYKAKKHKGEPTPEQLKWRKKHKIKKEKKLKALQEKQQIQEALQKQVFTPPPETNCRQVDTNDRNEQCYVCMETDNTINRKFLMTCSKCDKVKCHTFCANPPTARDQASEWICNTCQTPVKKKGQRDNDNKKRKADEVEAQTENIVCSYCMKEEKPGRLQGKFIGPFATAADGVQFVHEWCAFWSNHVIKRGENWFRIQLSLREARTQVCDYCKELGAGIKCSADRCRNKYHYGCALKAKCDFDILFPDKIQFCCNKHSAKVSVQGLEMPESDEKDSCSLPENNYNDSDDKENMNDNLSDKPSSTKKKNKRGHVSDTEDNNSTADRTPINKNRKISRDNSNKTTPLTLKMPKDTAKGKANLNNINNNNNNTNDSSSDKETTLIRTPTSTNKKKPVVSSTSSSSSSVSSSSSISPSSSLPSSTSSSSSQTTPKTQTSSKVSKQHINNNNSASTSTEKAIHTDKMSAKSKDMRKGSNKKPVENVEAAIINAVTSNNKHNTNNNINKNINNTNNNNANQDATEEVSERASRLEPYPGNPKDWSIEQTADWVVKRVKLPATYGEMFIENEVNGIALLALKKEDLQQIGITKVGPLTALTASIAQLKKRFVIVDI